MLRLLCLLVRFAGIVPRFGFVDLAGSVRSGAGAGREYRIEFVTRVVRLAPARAAYPHLGEVVRLLCVRGVVPLVAGCVDAAVGQVGPMRDDRPTVRVECGGVLSTDHLVRDLAGVLAHGSL